MMERVRVVVLAVALVAVLSGPAFAVPTLQLYIDGATYDTATQTWEISSGTFDLWVLGNVGADGPISNVKLSAAYFNSGDAGSLTLTPTTTMALADPSTPATPLFLTSGTYPNAPIKGNGSPLAAHGIFNDPSLNHWDVFALGDFTLTDSPIGDYQYGVPTAFPSMGQINVYSVTVSGWTRVHFDAFDTTVQTNDKPHVEFAPFSHDSGGNSTPPIPEPGTILLLGSGLAGLALRGWKKMGRFRA